MVTLRIFVQQVPVRIFSGLQSVLTEIFADFLIYGQEHNIINLNMQLLPN
jgi:hypothetical protein